MSAAVYVARTYSLPMLLALMVHALALFALWRGWQVPDLSKLQVVKPVIVSASLVTVKAERSAEAPAPPRPAAPAETPGRAGAQRTPPEPDVPAKPLEVPPEVNVQSAVEEKIEEARRQRAEARSRNRAQISDWFEQAIGSEAESVEQVELQIASQSYLDGIANRVAENWSRPPSARNGMEVELMIELVPTGDVVSVSVVRSSGNTAFDRSAENAVRHAQRFVVPEDHELFENSFRRFRILFKPEDLMR